ncbi:MFS transporter, partial [Variovorax sp. Varisp62]
DPERKGEDVLWVGPTGSGEALWQYIRTFMEDGMDAVPKPSEHEWLRKGFSGPGEHLEETVMHGSHMRDDIVGQGTSGATYSNYAVNFLWAPLHSLAERLCYWPTFPEEWNSDCGQKRRESGIGPEEPMRWTSRT